MTKKHSIFVTLFVIAFIIILIVLNLPKTSKPQTRTKTVKPSSFEALSACDAGLQSIAVRSKVLDLSSLGISTCYQLDATFSEAQQQIYANSKVTYANLNEQPISDLVFRLYPNSNLIYGGNISIYHVTIGNETVNYELYLDETALRIPLLTSLLPDQSITITINYHFKPPVDFGSDGVYGIFNLDSTYQTYVLANWFPILATRINDIWVVHPVDGLGDAVTSDISLFKVIVHAPAGWQVVTTGLEIPSDIQQTTAHLFVSGPTRDFLLVVSPNLEKHSDLVDGIQINQWLPSSTPSGWQHALEVGVQSLKTFSTLYGEYPYAELDIISTPLQRASGVEYPGLILIADKEYKPTTDAQNEQTVVIAHEIAHQWWYGVVGNDVTLNPWQDEGLTTYSTLIFLQEYEPSIFNYLLTNYQQRVSSYELVNGKERLNQSTNAFISRPAAYSTIVYSKAALFFWNLETKIGRPTLNQALSDYYRLFSYHIAKPEDLLDVIEHACDCQLDAYFQDWRVLD